MIHFLHLQRVFSQLKFRIILLGRVRVPTDTQYVKILEILQRILEQSLLVIPICSYSQTFSIEKHY